MRLLHGLVLVLLLLMADATRLPANTPSVPTFPNLSEDPLYDAETYQALHDVLIDVSWNQVELRKVLRDLSLAVRTARPISAGIDFRMSSTAPPDMRQRKVSVTLKRTSVYRVLEYLSQQAGFTIKVHPGIVQVFPKPPR